MKIKKIILTAMLGMLLVSQGAGSVFAAVGTGNGSKASITTEGHMTKKQTAGREALGKIAPKFAELNDDVLFGEVWSRTDKLSLRDRSLVTVVTMVAKGMFDSSFKYHMATARANGVTREEMAEILTQEAFYAGWPNAWAAFRTMKEVYGEDENGTAGK